MRVRVMAVDVAGSGSEETRARLARLAALESAAGATEWIVTGHHRDDDAETVLGNLLRGAGATGLSGIAPRRDRYVRPLLSLPGSLVRAAADELRLPYRDDPANQDLRHQRNVVRHRVLPSLEQGLGVDVRRGLHRTARMLSADDAVLERLADAVPILEDCGGALVPAPLLVTLPRPVAARAIRRALRLVRPPYPGSAAEIAAAIDVALHGGRRQLLAGWHAVREGAHVALVPSLELLPVEAVELVAPGVVSFGHGHTITATAPQSAHSARVVPRETAQLDAAATGTHFDIRCAHRGERIDIGGGSKSVRDAMAEADVAVRHRATWPVVAVRGRIAWVPAVRTATWARAGDAAEGVVEVRWERNTR
jgi:tRNA(Ile)-lysidine synthase